MRRSPAAEDCEARLLPLALGGSVVGVVLGLLVEFVLVVVMMKS